MMGQQSGLQDNLFYSFNLEEHVPNNHFLRSIDQFFDLGNLRKHLTPFYSHTGRPSIDPELMIRMLIVGYCFGIRSERRLCEEVHLNLAYRWFCRLGLEDPVPNHSTFSKNRHGRFRESDALRFVFESVLRRCMKEGLVQGEGFAIDASIIKADANRSKHTDAAGAANWKLEEGQSRAVREYIEALKENNLVNDDDELYKTNTTPSNNISLTDPKSRFTSATGGKAFYAYSTNYLIDLHAGIIMDVEATPSTLSEEVGSTRTMINRVEERFNIKPKKIVGDTAYGAAPMLGWLVDKKNIAPHIPVIDKTDRTDGTLSSNDFAWNESDDEYRCPAGKALRKNWRPFKQERSHITKEGTIIYRSSQRDCAGCPNKDKCCPTTPIRKISRSIHEAARDVARQIRTTSEYAISRCERKKVEMLFAHLKKIMKLDRLRLRGISGAQDEFLLAATTQNLRRMAKWMTKSGKKKQIAMA